MSALIPKIDRDASSVIRARIPASDPSITCLQLAALRAVPHFYLLVTIFCPCIGASLLLPRSLLIL